MDFHRRYKALNTAQRQAVDTIDGPVMVIAGPGTGKTELLAMRAANILNKTDTLASNILCLTFTDSGAAAMRERLTQIIGADAYKLGVQTFHSFGSDVINQNGQYFYEGAAFRPADDLNKYEILKSIFDSLDHKNPLTTMLNDEYTYLNDTMTAIGEIKRSGLTSDELLMILDANTEVIDAAERLLAPVFSDRISLKTTPKLQAAIKPIRNSGGKVKLATLTPLSRVLADSLQLATDQAEADNNTKPITAWKNQWLTKNQAGEYVLKSRVRQDKLRAVSYIYYQYLMRMQEAQLYDFDDMILQVVHAMEVFTDLRLNLQEKYQYIMVDEFQDTNMAQMRILHNLTNNDLFEGKPNIMVVGDDDQAIFSFQGADVGNISHFNDLFPAAARITLTDNYRSTPDILTKARQVIVQANDRLEDRLPDLDKTLKSHVEPNDASVSLYENTTLMDERSQLANSIFSRLKQGTPPSSIAVIARKHAELLSLLPYLAEKNIKVSYERHDNVLDNELVILLEKLSQLVTSISEQKFNEADALLPEVLAHPAFNIPALKFWQLSLNAYKARQLWLEQLAGEPGLQQIYNWLITQAKAMPYTPLEQMIDNLVGTEEVKTGEFRSPIYDYYFNPDNLRADPDKYLLYLEAIRTIRSKLRDYQPDTTPTLGTFTDFIRLNQKRGNNLMSTSPAAATSDAINLMTAHKSKGLEFDTVYIFGAVDTTWGERVRTRNRLIDYPENLPLKQAGDSVSERIRLFFVAMTRAKKNLILSYSLAGDNAKTTLRASFLANETWQPIQLENSGSNESRLLNAKLEWYQPIISPIKPDMKAALLPTINNYKLSITHLNNFLDVSRGGPQTFLMQNLIRFPRALHPSASYGIAVHNALQRAHSHLAAHGSQKPIEDVLRDYETSLSAMRLALSDYEHYLQKGSDVLTNFLKERYDMFNRHQKVEVSFSSQSVYVGEAHLTGSLDVLDIHDSTISLIDYKTGKPSGSWRGQTDYEKIKLHKYKQQLMFYDLLIKNSKDFSKYQVNKRVLQFVEPDLAGKIVCLEADFSTDEYDRFQKLIKKVWQCIIDLDLPDTQRFEPSYKGMLAFEAFLLDES